ncbi:MAG: L-seryl-tRNA(Sec) selenium transferase [Candidatus Eremiobacteraeota bacterium]|nr:L-seryl-tRNA(Sec) selenium transferase [Candidatus Eremiobacteraeota bacterium]
MHAVLADRRLAAYEAELGRNVVRRAAEEELGRARASGSDSYDAIVENVGERLEGLRRQALLPVINATGIVIHTNLGRAPLGASALAAVAQLSRGYSNLEYDVETGERGSRYSRVAGLLNDVTGAPDSLVVNNCAAAVLLVLDTFARGREVIVARNALVEVGGGFRLPDVLERSGARLVEVGTTNRVYADDFERALSPQTALLLRTHPSNYRIDGFVHDASARELVELGRRAGITVAEDLGSGALVDLAAFGVVHERTVQEAVNDGVGVIVFSGDKLLGGPQAGIIVGHAHLIARLRANPLLRALRVGKMTLAALGATLEFYRSGSFKERVPIYRMLSASLDELRERAKNYADAVPGAVPHESDAYVGGGALAQERVPSVAIAIHDDHPDLLARRLRAGTPPIVARIADGRLMLDLRTMAPEEDEIVIAALCRDLASR